MNHSTKYVDQISLRLFASMIAVFTAGMLVWWLFGTVFGLPPAAVLIGVVAIVIVTSLLVSLLLARMLNQPLAFLSRVLAYKLHPSYTDVEPNPRDVHIGYELVTSLAQQVYDLAAMGAVKAKALSVPTKTAKPIPVTEHPYILDSIPLPIIALDRNQQIKMANKAASVYLGSSNLLGRALVDVLNLSFPSEDTYETWLNDSRQSRLVDAHSWRHVRHEPGNSQPLKQFDLSASFTKDAASGIEVVLALFDQTSVYAHNDQDVSFLSLAVHELRTPLTVLRGYIEVFEEELGPTLTPELKAFMYKMNASAKQLTAFVSNILNVARAEADQLVLHLREEQWEPLLRAAVTDLSLQASVRGKQITLAIDRNLPSVAVDRVSIFEVINNLVENAIKYGGHSNEIRISSRVNSEGLIETSVTDFGVGISTAVLPHLFEKFYRSHLTKGEIGGTGLGLYLCKAIMKAHGGNISVESKEGQGSTFKFSLLPYSQLKDEAKQAGQDGIIRGAHGWIKNHNIYRQ